MSLFVADAIQKRPFCECADPDQNAQECAMKNGLYSVSVRGFDGEDWPPGGVVVLLDGVMLGGGPYTYYTGSYSFKDGVFKGELVLNQHNFPPPSQVFFNAKNVGIGVTGSYEGDQAELTGIALVGKRSLTLHVTLLRLAELKPHRAREDRGYAA